MLWSYWDVVRTGFLSHLALPFSSPTFYFAALAFGVGAPLALYAASLAGGAAASLLHTVVGAGLVQFNQAREQPSFVAFRRNMERWGVWILVIPGLRFAGMLTILFALIGVSPRRVLLASVLGLAFGYAITSFLSHDNRMLTYFLTR